jgi:competence ComEA-like helix-hairpin-helix protein
MATRSRSKIDINTATAKDIQRACGIDGALAERIVKYRDEHGAFKTREDLDDVPGFADVRTDEVLSVVDLPAGKPGTQRQSSQGRATRSSAAHAGSRSTSGSTLRSGSRTERAASTGGRHASSRSAEPTTDHDFIRHWVEERGGWPARVKGTGRDDDPGILRIDFPDFSGAGRLERISWEEWFRQFDANNLAFLHRDIRHRDGQLDRFNKLVRRDAERG